MQLPFLEIILNIESMENKEGLIWYNGNFIDWKDAKLHVLTHGLHYASSVFEGERSYSAEFLNFMSIPKDYFFLQVN